MRITVATVTIAAEIVGFAEDGAKLFAKDHKDDEKGCGNDDDDNNQGNIRCLDVIERPPSRF